jgi:hypothetical protein
MLLTLQVDDLVADEIDEIVLVNLRPHPHEYTLHCDR